MAVRGLEPSPDPLPPLRKPRTQEAPREYSKEGSQRKKYTTYIRGGGCMHSTPVKGNKSFLDCQVEASMTMETSSLSPNVLCEARGISDGTGRLTSDISGPLSIDIDRELLHNPCHEYAKEGDDVARSLSRDKPTSQVYFTSISSDCEFENDTVPGQTGNSSRGF